MKLWKLERRDMLTEKYNCGNCDFWLEDASLKPTDGPGIKLSDGGERKISCGFCRKDPPAPYMVMEPNALDPRVGQMKQKRMMPITLSGEICSHHPVLRADVLRGMVAGCVRAYLDMLDYKPGKYPDETAAGFSRPPTLAEAKGLAAGATEKPTAPVDKVAT
jgi:hypothetical protein